jgi:hypothetical protein
MPASYPSAIKTFTTLVDGVDDVLASHQNDPNAEITAIETELGTNPRGSAADVKARLDAAHTAGGLHTLKIATGDIIDLNVTEAKLAASAVAQGKLKTSIGEVSSGAGQRIMLTLPGGEYGFYPQHKSSTGNNENSHFWQVGGGGFPVTLGTTYQTRLTIWADSGQTLSAQQRYVTASGLDLWVFAIVEVATGDIVAAWQAFDHPAYGNGGDPATVPHPFTGTPLPPGTALIILSKAAAQALLAEARTQRRGILDVLNGEFEPDLGSVAPFVPLHTGFFDPDLDAQSAQKRDPETKALLWAPRMLTQLPVGVSCHGGGPLNPIKRQQRRDRVEARIAAAATKAAQRTARLTAIMAKLKTAAGLTDEELATLQEALR